MTGNYAVLVPHYVSALVPASFQSSGVAAYRHLPIRRALHMAQIIKHFIYIPPVIIGQVVLPFIFFSHAIHKYAGDRCHQLAYAPETVYAPCMLQPFVCLRAYGYIHTLSVMHCICVSSGSNCLIVPAALPFFPPVLLLPSRPRCQYRLAGTP